MAGNPSKWEGRRDDSKTMVAWHGALDFVLKSSWWEFNLRPTSFTSLWSFWLASSDLANSLLAVVSCSSISPTCTLETRNACKHERMQTQRRANETWMHSSNHFSLCHFFSFSFATGIAAYIHQRAAECDTVFHSASPLILYLYGNHRNARPTGTFSSKMCQCFECVIL